MANGLSALIMAWRHKLPSLIEDLNQYLQYRPVKKILNGLGVGYAEQIPTHTQRDELQTLFWLAYSLPEGSLGLEIGSYLGASTCYIAAGLAHRKGHLLCVDTWNNETMPEGLRDTYLEFCRNIDPIHQSIIAIRKDSSKLDSQDIPQKVDLVFIDGDHSYEAVKKDFLIISNFISESGIVAFHDCLAFPGVSQVIGEALSTGWWRIAGMRRNLFWIKKVGVS
jgi:predicted O-methyltransferase YrrM